MSRDMGTDEQLYAAMRPWLVVWGSGLTSMCTHLKRRWII